MIASLSKNTFIAVNAPHILQSNLVSVQARIDRACQRADRSPEEIRLLPVSKTVDARTIEWAINAGLNWFGENKVQELLTKAEIFAGKSVKWSAIGHLQSNKCKHVAEYADEFQALDRLKIAHHLQRHLDTKDRVLDVLVQVNSSGERTKFGLPPDQVASFLSEIASFDRLRVKGLMTLAVFSNDTDKVRACFKLMRNLQQHLRDSAPDSISLETLSMGMSSDFEVAIEEGATLVRVGQAIFGPRTTPDSHYWPQTMDRVVKPKAENL